MESTKKKLVLSVVSVLLCAAMVFGTTYVWSSNRVTSENNGISDVTDNEKGPAPDVLDPNIGNSEGVYENADGAVNPNFSLADSAKASPVSGGFRKAESASPVSLEKQESKGGKTKSFSLGGDIFDMSGDTESIYRIIESKGTLPKLVLPERISVPIPQSKDDKGDNTDDTGNTDEEIKENVKIESEIVLRQGSVTAVVPVGTEFVAGTEEIVLSVKQVSKKDGNVSIADPYISRLLDVHIEGVAETNTVPIFVTIENALPDDLNKSSVVIHHTEKNVKNLMASKNSLEAVTAHNDYYFDNSGNLTMALAHFSEILIDADTSNPWVGTSNKDWYSSSKTEFTLSTAEELAGFAELVNAGNTFAGKTVKLGKNIIVNNWVVNNTAYTVEQLAANNNIVYKAPEADKPLYFEPVGTSANPFKGTFDGNNHYISGLYRIHFGEDGGYDNKLIGVFGCVDGATVKNLSVRDSFVESYGGLVGLVSATAKGNSTFSGITLKNNYVLTYNEYLGGIVGHYMSGTGTFTNITVNNSNNFGALWGTYDLPCGGIIGGVDSDTEIYLTNCDVSCSMELYNDCCANYQWFAYRYSGMLVGYLPGKDIASFAKNHIHCSECEVSYGEWSDQYYCELRSLGKGSYNGDTQWKYTKISREKGVNGTCGHDHAGNNQQTTTWKGKTYGPDNAHEDHICENIQFHQLFGGGQGVYGVETAEGVILNENSGTIRVKFKNVDKYLYRVGNGNDVKLGSLFEKEENTFVKSSDVVVYAENANGVTGVDYTANTTDWTQGTLKFKGTGAVRIVLEYRDQKVTLPLEVVAAKNVTAYSELTTSSCVLLNDITMSSDGSRSFSNATLYGNGFVFDVRAGKITGKSAAENYIVKLTTSKLDNVQIIGSVYTEYGAMSSEKYNNACVLTDGNSVIANSYVSNCASAVRVGGGNLEIINSTIKGGNFANIDIRNGHVIVENVTTINQGDSNDEAADGSSVIGLGIVSYYESVTDSSLTIKGKLTQHNHMSKTESGNMSNDYAQTFSSQMFKSTYSAYQYKSGSETWVNSGIIAMNDVFTVTGYDSSYVKSNVTFYSQNGMVVAPKACAPVKAPAYESTAQYAITPATTFDWDSWKVAQEDGSNDYMLYRNGEVVISMDKGDTTEWNPHILTVTKNGKTLPYQVTMNGKTYGENEKITFSDTEEASYIVKYSYTDSNNFNADLSEYSKTYEKQVKVHVYAVSAKAKAPEFTMNNSAAVTKKINGSIYVMPSSDAYKFTLSGTSETVNYIYVEVNAEHNKKPQLPVFGDFLKIQTYDSEGKASALYSKSTTAMPDALKLLGGQAGSGSSYTGGTPTTDLTKLFQYASATAAKGEPEVVSNQLVYCASDPSTNARNEFYFFTKYCYTDPNTATPYYYYVCYHTNSLEASCIAKGTLITLADGSQVPVENLKGDENLLVWNLETGRYEEAPIVFVDHDPETEYEIIHLYFSDGTDVKVISEHGFFDAESGKYVYIDAYNYNDYIGHRFVKQADIEKNEWEYVTLDKVEIETEITEAYSPVTFEHLVYYVNGMLSMPGGIDGMFNIFDVDIKTMKYDSEKMENDILEYGLLPYSEFEALIPENMYYAFNGKWLAVAIGKGNITWEDIAYLAERYSPLAAK